MIDRRPSTAVNAYVERLQRAASCITDAVIVVGRGGYQPADAPHELTLGAGVPVRLAGTGRIALAVGQKYRIVRASGDRGPWQVEIAAYYYALDDADGREILAYHWHPRVQKVPFPHLHISHGAVSRELLDRAQLSLSHNSLRPDLAGAHLPTRQITLDEVLRLAIEQFGVEPRRDDWDAVLQPW